MNWNLMDSAPKDGTRIIVSDGQNCYVVAWLDCRTNQRQRKRMNWAIPESWQDEQGGYFTVDAPVSWMPCPKI